jgi:hypothetical protein
MYLLVGYDVGGAAATFRKYCRSHGTSVDSSNDRFLFLPDCESPLLTGLLYFLCAIPASLNLLYSSVHRHPSSSSNLSSLSILEWLHHALADSSRGITIVHYRHYKLPPEH